MESYSVSNRVSPRTIWGEAISGIVQRPGRAALTALGTVIGITVFITVLALTSSASLQVSRQFDLQEATLLRVTQEPAEHSDVGKLYFPMDSPVRSAQIDGVTTAALTWNFLKVPVTSGARTVNVSVRATTSEIDELAQASFTKGKGLDPGHDARASRVAVIGTAVASDLRISGLERSPAIIIDGVPFTVIGIIGDTARLPDLLSTVLIPATTAREIWNDPNSEVITFYVGVRPGAANVVAEQLPFALSPTKPEVLKVKTPPDPKGLRQSIDKQLSGLFLMLAAVCLVIGIIGIANTAFVAVMERTGEIGLRRAMGARPGHIALQFIMEAAVLGLLGGLVGTSLGVLLVVIISAGLGWTAAVPPLLLPLGPITGLLSGIVGGLLPARRASTIEPVAALRS